MQHVAPLLTVGADDDLDVPRLGEVGELILGPVGGAAGVGARGAVAARGGGGAAGGEGGGAVDERGRRLRVRDHGCGGEGLLGGAGA